MTLRLGNKKVCPTKLVKVNNVDFSKISLADSYSFEVPGNSTSIELYNGRLWMSQPNSGFFPRGSSDEIYATKFVNFSQPFEINVKFTAPTDTTRNHVLFGNGYSGQYFHTPASEFMYTSGDTILWCGLSSDGSSWNEASIGFDTSEISRVAGDIYECNYKYDGSKYTVTVKHNNETATKSVDVTGTPYYSNASNSSGSYFSFAKNANNYNTAFYGGWLYLDNTYIKQNGVLVWGCEEGQVLNKYPQANIIKHGGLEEKKEIILDNFSTSSYGYKSIPSLGNKPWELECEFLSNNISVAQEVIGISTRGASPFYFLDGYIKLFLSSNGSSWDIAGGTTLLSLSESTTYHMKISYDTSKYVVSRYIGSTWQTLATVNSSTPIYSDGNLWIGVNQRGSSPSWPLLGSMNLNKCSLKVDGETVWQGTTEAIE